MTGDIPDSRIPAFTRGHRLQHDRVRDLWIIQAPEKAFIAEETAVDILRLVDGTNTVGMIVSHLAAAFSAPAPVIGADVRALFSDLAARGVLRL